MKVLFVVGNSRSGTTMLGRMFGRHSHVHTFGELHFFEHQVDAATTRARTAWDVQRRVDLIERLLTSARNGFFAKTETDAYRAEAQRILAKATGDDPISAYESFLHYETARHGKSVPCEQTPRYLYFVNEILNAFPDAVVINLIRDPRDIVLSQKNKWRRRFFGAKSIPMREAIRSWVNYHPYTIARLWVSAVRTARRHEGNSRFMSLRFEDLLRQPEATVRLLCGFTGLPYEADMLLVPQVGSSAGMDKPDQKGIDATRAGSWRHGGLTNTELAICQQVAGEDMQRLQYEPVPVSHGMLKRWGSMGIFVVKVSIALLLNLKRTKNLRETLKRRLGKETA